MLTHCLVKFPSDSIPLKKQKCNFFGAVGTPIGAVTGAVIGLATETGLFRGAGIGAISGAVFSVEAVESSVALWHSSDSGIWSILYVVSQL